MRCNIPPNNLVMTYSSKPGNVTNDILTLAKPDLQPKRKLFSLNKENSKIYGCWSRSAVKQNKNKVNVTVT